ncbi:polynucleotide 5'-hydroxyl-kinase NOL9-like isoform X1 [Bolinopsis microptera]|uniref:polynucleotide 5'-hydroxyl-kinase NOL9-like isoform X1 n=1 Tax=Bolinopsis microptera TaxID=2820187 RepID=UPI003079F5DB
MVISIPVAGNSVVIQLQRTVHYNIRCYDTSLRVLVGECHINGYRLSSESSSLTLNSMESHSRISLNTGNSSNISNACVKKCLVEIGAEQEDCQVIDNIGAVILIESSNISTSLLRSTYKRIWTPTSEEEEPLVKLDYFQLYSGLNKAVCISGEWSAPVTSLLSKPGRIAVCGPQNSGKSTLCRYTVNKLLEHHRTVLFLEGDIGQSELTPSGLVTLSVLREPLINPPYCSYSRFVKDLTLASEHLTAESYCVGVSSPAQVMREYLEKVKFIVSKARKLNVQGNVPLVVNFMGWTKGFGVALHADILRMLEPTHVINLQNNSPKDLPPILELIETPGILPEHENKIHIPPTVLNIPGHISTNTTPGFQAFELRHLASLNYFAPIYNSASAIVAPYKIRWSHVSVIIPEGVEENLAAYTLSCSVVALLTGPPPAVGSQGINIVDDDNASSMKCLGLGIVRAIDIKEKVFYLNTPVDKETLDQVFVFKHTSLPVPHVPSGSLPTPYISNLAASEILGMGSRSQRANLKRRYHAVS